MTIVFSLLNSQSSFYSWNFPTQSYGRWRCWWIFRLGSAGWPPGRFFAKLMRTIQGTWTGRSWELPSVPWQRAVVVWYRFCRLLLLLLLLARNCVLLHVYLRMLGWLPLRSESHWPRWILEGWYPQTHPRHVCKRKVPWGSAIAPCPNLVIVCGGHKCIQM